MTSSSVLLGLPVMIGVIGHRDLLQDEIPIISASFQAIIADVRDRAGSTPVWVLSSLAEGADQVAVAACRDLDVHIVAALPMPADEYELDFAAGAPRDEFRRLLNAADRVFVADDLLREGGRQLNEEYRDPKDRSLAYRRCARLVSDCSHMLIAAWDGKAPDFLGGTSDTIGYRVPGALRPATPQEGLWAPLGGITIHIPAHRQRHLDAPARTDGLGAMHGPLLLASASKASEWTAGGHDPLLDGLDALNHRLRAEPNLQKAPTSLGGLLLLADEEAVREQRRFRALASWVLGVGVLALLMVNAEQSMRSGALVASAFTVIAVAGGLWWLLTRIGVKKRFLEYRALAEGARIQQAWRDCGLIDCVADTYLLGQADLSWIRRCLRSAWLVDMTAGSSGAHGRVDHVRSWMSGQLAYFDGRPGRPGAIQRNRRSARRFEALSLLGIATAICALLVDAARSLLPLDVPVGMALGVQLAWELGLSGAAACAAYGQLLAFTETGRRYATAREVYAQGLAQVDLLAPTEEVGIRRIARQVGLEAMSETSGWVATHRDRQVRPV